MSKLQQAFFEKTRTQKFENEKNAVLHQRYLYFKMSTSNVNLTIKLYRVEKVAMLVLAFFS